MSLQFKKNIVDLVKNLRKSTNVSQEEIVNYIGVSRLTYISAENGKRDFKENEMIRDGEIAIKDEKLHNYNQQRIIVLKDNLNFDFFNLTDKENKKEKSNYTPYSDLPESKKIVDDVLDTFLLTLELDPIGKNL